MKKINFSEKMFFHYFDETEEIKKWEDIKSDKDISDKDFILKKLFNSYEEQLCSKEDIVIKRKIDEEYYLQLGIKKTHYSNSQFELLTKSFIGGVNYRHSDELGIYNPPTYIYKIPLENFKKILIDCEYFSEDKSEKIKAGLNFPLKITMENNLESIYHDYYFDKNDIGTILLYFESYLAHCNFILKSPIFYSFLFSKKNKERKITYKELEYLLLNML